MRKAFGIMRSLEEKISREGCIDTTIIMREGASSDEIFSHFTSFFLISLLPLTEMNKNIIVCTINIVKRELETAMLY